jgi:hypothetical protein
LVSSTTRKKVDNQLSIDEQRRWCLFTSAGDRNAIRLWLQGDAPRRWDLVIAYYGDNNDRFSEISELCFYAFRTKGSKFQNLKTLILEHPKFFDRYSHVWTCDDDILMSMAQINEAFELTETLGFWVAQPAVLAEGRNAHWITCFAGPQWDYRIVNFVENGLAIFRRDKLTEFLAVYDGSVTSWGIEWWYANLFKANEVGRFAIIDKVRVINPTHQSKGGGEIERLRAAPLRAADWNTIRQKYDLVEYPHKVFAYCKLAPEGELSTMFLPRIDPPPISPAWLDMLGHLRIPGMVRLLKTGVIVRTLLETVRRSGWHDAIWSLKCALSIRRQARSLNDQ